MPLVLNTDDLMCDPAYISKQSQCVVRLRNDSDMKVSCCVCFLPMFVGG